MATIIDMDTENNNTTLQEVYVIALAESDEEFDWIYIHPKPYYLTEAEAVEIRNSLIENEESVTENNSIVKKMYRVKPEKEQKKNKMENKKSVKQIMILDDKMHQGYLETFVEEPLNFQDFVNFELGNLFDEERKIEQIIPNESATQFIIIYSIKL